MKIMVVDDDLDLLGLIGFALRQAGYLVISAANGTEALAVFDREQPDLVILDINLPGLNGFEVCHSIRAAGSTPIMLLTARTGEEDQVNGLDLGADDYLTKPFSPRTLLARVRALLRRAGIERPSPLAVGDLALDVERQAVSVRGGMPIRLTNREFRLMQYMIANLGHTISTERLTNHVWGYQGVGDRQLLKQLVHRRWLIIPTCLFIAWNAGLIANWTILHPELRNGMVWPQLWRWQLDAPVDMFYKAGQLLFKRCQFFKNGRC